MSRQTRAIILSLFLHAAAVASVWAMSCSFNSLSQPVTIDLSLLDAGGLLAGNGLPADRHAGGPCLKPPEKAFKKKKPVENDVHEPIVPLAETRNPAPDALSDTGAIEPLASSDPDIQATGGTAAVDGAESPFGSGSSSMPGGAQRDGHALYTAEQFNYIKEMIRKNLVYPHMARKLGVEGSVVLAFIVLPDGGVKDVRVTISSGSSILDSNAVTTVRKTAPFPRPPVEAEIIIPVVYRLK